MWLQQIAYSYIHQTLGGPLGRLAAISDCYPNVQAMAADVSRQEWCTCRVWDSAHSVFLSSFQQPVFTFFSCWQGIVYIHLYPGIKILWQSPASRCLIQDLAHHALVLRDLWIEYGKSRLELKKGSVTHRSVLAKCVL